jgi:hypothetical protein
MWKVLLSHYGAHQTAHQAKKGRPTCDLVIYDTRAVPLEVALWWWVTEMGNGVMEELSLDCFQRLAPAARSIQDCWQDDSRAPRLVFPGHPNWNIDVFASYDLLLREIG